MRDEYYADSYEKLPILEDQRPALLPGVRANDADFPHNPTPVDRPFWKTMVGRGSAQAWDARNVFGLKIMDESPGPQAVFCFHRFGRTETRLPDGRIVYIGGEHEDFYDPDFYIYNDVVVVRGRDEGDAEEEEEDAGDASDADSDVSDSYRSYVEYMKEEKIKDNLKWAVSAAGAGPADIDIYGYPKDVFPPTDFHTATYYKDESSGREYIYVIGGLGYGDGPHRAAMLVHRLDLRDYSMQRVATSGETPPPRVDTDQERKAELEGGRILYTVGSDGYILSLADRRWSKA